MSNNSQKIGEIKTAIADAIQSHGADAVATSNSLVDIIGAIAAGGTPPEPNTGTLLLVNQEWMQIASLNGNILTIASRGVFNTTATRHILSLIHI